MVILAAVEGKKQQDQLIDTLKNLFTRRVMVKMIYMQAHIPLAWNSYISSMATVLQFTSNSPDAINAINKLEQDVLDGMNKSKADITFDTMYQALKSLDDKRSSYQNYDPSLADAKAYADTLKTGTDSTPTPAGVAIGPALPIPPRLNKAVVPRRTVVPQPGGPRFPVIKNSNKSIFDDIGHAFSDAGNAIANTATDAVNAAGNAAKDAGNAIANTANDAAHAISGGANDAVNGASGAANAAGNAINGAANDAANGVVDAANTTGNAINNAIHRIPDPRDGFWPGQLPPCLLSALEFN